LGGSRRFLFLWAKKAIQKRGIPREPMPVTQLMAAKLIIKERAAEKRIPRMENGEGRFRVIEPKILYFGTPVALISSLNEDGSTNLAPISSFWALGWTCMLGLLDETKTADNLARHAECVVNVPSPDLWQEVEKLAPLTGKNPVPEIKANQFRFVADKFQASGLSPAASEVVRPARVAECPVQMEARVNRLHRMSGERLEKLGGGVAAEVEVARVHVAEEFVLGEHYVDPEKWSPLIYNFRHYFRLAEHELGKTFRAER
jgi:flavin reductase (DIM6/NTAB) family NADH-FMN oxidoreductase RutF